MTFAVNFYNFNIAFPRGEGGPQSGTDEGWRALAVWNKPVTDPNMPDYLPHSSSVTALQAATASPRGKPWVLPHQNNNREITFFPPYLSVFDNTVGISGQGSQIFYLKIDKYLLHFWQR